MCFTLWPYSCKKGEISDIKRRSMDYPQLGKSWLFLQNPLVLTWIRGYTHYTFHRVYTPTAGGAYFYQRWLTTGCITYRMVIHTSKWVKTQYRGLLTLRQGLTLTRRFIHFTLGYAFTTGFIHLPQGLYAHHRTHSFPIGGSYTYHRAHTFTIGYFYLPQGL
mgnify:CR=1 FL=1